MDALRRALTRSRDLGFLGPGDLDRHIEHAQGFVRTIRWALCAGSADGSDGSERSDVGGRRSRTAPSSPLSDHSAGLPPHQPGVSPPSPSVPISGRLVDLGAGGGVPGLVVATELPEVEVVLLEVNARRSAFLGEAVAACGLDDRVTVVQGRAEEIGRSPDWRGGFSIATARSFGPPAVTAECAAPLLKVDAILVTSEPPEDLPEESTSTRRAPGRWPAEGLALLGMAPSVPHREGYAFQVVRQTAPCPTRFPRRVGVPAKRPLF